MSVEESAKAMDFKGVVLGLVISSFSFVMALFWRDAIRETINQFVPAGEGLAYLYYAAIIVTIISVLAIYVMAKYMQRSIIRKVVTKERIYGIDNKLIGRDLTIRKRNKKQTKK
jgi:hypothetical protein